VMALGGVERAERDDSKGMAQEPYVTWLIDVCAVAPSYVRRRYCLSQHFP